MVDTCSGTSSGANALHTEENGKLRTVFDLQEQNDNTVKDVTLFPDQDIICNDMARVAYRSKLDMSEAYEQIHIIPEHVHKTAFATVLGTFRSQVMQMGDCNAPSTFQQLMTAIFQDCISRFVHVYLDNIFIYSRSIEEHEKYPGIVFQQLRDHHLFLSKSVRALARLDLFPFLSLFSLYGLSYCMPELTSLTLLCP